MRVVMVVQLGGRMAAAESVPGSVCWSGGGGAGQGGSRLGQEPWISGGDESDGHRDCN